MHSHLKTINWSKLSLSSPCFLFESLLDFRKIDAVYGLQTTALDESECRRADRFVNDLDRGRFVIGRALVRLAVSEHLQIPIDGVELEISDSGKPVLHADHKDNLDFSISHSANKIFVSVFRSGRTGIDVEVLRDVSPLDGLCGLILSDAEITDDHIQATSSDAIVRAFSAKEAILKMQGVGLAGGMTSINLPRIIPFQGSGWAQIETPRGAEYLARLHMPGGFCAYLAMNRRPLRIYRRFVSIPKLAAAFEPTASTRLGRAKRLHWNSSGIGFVDA